MLPQVCQLQGLVWIHPQVSYSDKHEARFELLANAHKGPPPHTTGHSSGQVDVPAGTPCRSVSSRLTQAERSLTIPSVF